MADYVLKLYRKKDPSLTVVKRGDERSFPEDEDQAAVAYAKSEYAEELAGCDYAALLDSDGRLVWEQGSVKGPRNA